MKKIICLSVVLVILSSCERDVVIDIPKEPSKIVMNGLINSNNIFRVVAGKSLYILDTATTSNLPTAQIALFENNVFKDSLIYNAASRAYLAKNNTRALPGNSYVIKASANGFANVEAATFTPVAVSIQNISRKTNARIINGTSYDEVKFSFADDVAKDNYYILRIRRPIFANGNTAQYENMYCIKSNDKDIDRKAGTDPTDFEACVDGEFFMNDKNFNGKQKEILLFVDNLMMASILNSTNGRQFKPIIELFHVTQDHYRYRKSYNKYKDAEDNPFAEPVLVYGNVTNGYGIVSVFNLVRDTIR